MWSALTREYLELHMQHVVKKNYLDIGDTSVKQYYLFYIVLLMLLVMTYCIMWPRLRFLRKFGCYLLPPWAEGAWSIVYVFIYNKQVKHTKLHMLE